MSISVFVTYCWEKDDHNNKVIQLTDHLRKKGFNAEMDRLKTQEETAVDLVVMMNRAMTEYDKVIIVLSENYKKKAEMFKGGVGTEYALIIKDISDHPRRYILVSFRGISNEIVPLSFKGREIVNLQDLDSGLKKLYEKLMDIGSIKFSDVASQLPVIDQHEIADILTNNAESSIKFIKINEHFIDDTSKAGRYTNCNRRICFVFQNNSGKSLDGCQVEIEVASKFLFSRDGAANNLSQNISKKIFSNVTFETEPIEIQVTSSNWLDAGKSIIKIKVFSDDGEVVKEIPILDCVHITSNYVKRRVELDDFLAS